MNRIEIKKALLLEAFESQEEGIVDITKFVNPICDTFEWELPNERFESARIYYQNDKVRRVLDLMPIDPRGVVDYWKGTAEMMMKDALQEPKVNHVYIFDDSEINSIDLVKVFFDLAKAQPDNITLLYVDHGLDFDIKFLPVFEAKKVSLTGVSLFRSYFRYLVTLGEGFGKKYENRAEALKLKVNKRLLKQWEKEIAKIEEQRLANIKKLKEEYENNKSEIRESATE